MDIGIVGIGMMGHGIATNLQKHGHRLTLLEHAGNQPLDGLIAGGATTRKTPKEVAKDVDLLILCVTGTPQVEAVLLSEEGALADIRKNAVVIDCSTAVPTSTEQLAKRVVEAGALFMDAPMTRTPKEAAQGRLNLLVGGDKALYEECLPVLKCFAENVVHAGPVGAGHRMKLLHNYVSLGSVALIAEAAACALRSGIAPETFLDVLAKGGGHGAALERLRPYLMAGDTSALRFAMGNAAKDLDYYTRMAGDTDAACSIAKAVLQTLSVAVEEAGPDIFLPELVMVLSTRGDAASSRGE